MKKIFFVLIFLSLIGATSFPQKNPTDQIETIVFMRHGEKPFLDFGQLNLQQAIWQHRRHVQ